MHMLKINMKRHISIIGILVMILISFAVVPTFADGESTEELKTSFTKSQTANMLLMNLSLREQRLDILMLKSRSTRIIAMRLRRLLMLCLIGVSMEL